jgi:inner membrane protein
MASLGHIAVGMAAARFESPRRATARPAMSAMLFWSALSFLPDADVVGFGFGIAYGDPWGHRGASHSLLFSLALGVAVGLGARYFHEPAFRTGALATLVVASHGLLDTLTNGGLGCALLWPVDLTRHFAPWRPIPVSPIGLGYLSPYGALVFVTELALFSPFLAYTLWKGNAVAARP